MNKVDDSTYINTDLAAGYVKDFSTDILLTTAFALTHQMHATVGTRREAQLRKQRDIVEAEIKRRCST